MELNPKSFLQHIQSLSCHLKGQKLLVAFSGGPDSVALLHLLWKIKKYLNIRVRAVYVNHNLRSVSKDLETIAYYKEHMPDFVFDVETVDVKSYALENGYSIEEAARYLRYQQLETSLKKHNYDIILTAHHKDDFAETVLMHILEGSGILGLAGIREQVDTLCRPLLPWGKKEIHRYCEQETLPYTVDETNFDQHFKRNQIRHSVLPYLKEIIAADIEDKLFRLGIIVQEEEKFWHRQLSGFKAERRGFFSSVPLRTLNQYSPTVIKLFIEEEIHFLTAHKISLSFNQFRNIMALLKQESGKINISTSMAVHKTALKLWIVKQIGWETVSIYQENHLYKCGVSGITCKYEEIGVSQFNKKGGTYLSGLTPPYQSIFIGTDIPVSLRLVPVANDDKFVPLGCDYPVSVRRYLIEKGIAPFLVNCYPVLKSEDGTVVAVPGFLPHEKFRVSEKSETIFKITFFNLEHFLV